VRANGQPIRRHLASNDCPMDFQVLAELRSEGATDYVAVPLVFTDSSIHVATWSTQQPGGFTPAQFSALESITMPLTRVAEIRALRRTATNLLDTYVGRQAGERILMGKSGAAMSKRSAP
jgi:adenylate cyclase